MKLIASLLFSSAFLFAVACSGNDDDVPSPTATSDVVPTLEAPTETPGTTATPTATAPPATNTPLPPTDGTVFPQNPGDTDPFEMKSNPDPNVGVYILTDVRVGAHPEQGGWDRIVFEFEDVEGFPGAHPGGIVEYTDEVFQCGSGAPVDVEGDAILRVRLDATQAHDDAGQLTIDALEIEGPGNSIIVARSICDFEGVVEWVIGVPAEQNFKVVFLQNPSRIVIDIKWP